MSLSLIIGVFGNASDVGIYNAALPIAFILTISLDLFKQLFFPIVTKEFSKGHKSVVKDLSQQVGKWIFTLSFPLLILIIIFPGELIKFIFGEIYMPASEALRFLSLGTMFIAIFDLSKELITIVGRTKLILLDVGSAAILNILLNFLLVPKYGITGAGIATMISMIFMSLIFAVQAKRILGVLPIRRKMAKIFVIGIIAGLALYFLKSIVPINLFSLIILTFFYFTLYLTLILLCGCLDKNDLGVVIFIKNKFLRFKENH